MALMKENINWFQQNGHTCVTKQRENISFYMQMDFKTQCKKPARIHWCTAEAKMSAGTGLSLVHLLFFPVESWAIPTSLQPDYMLLLGVILGHLAQKSAQTSQVSLVKIKGPLLSFILRRLPRCHLLLTLCIWPAEFTQLVQGNPRCADRPWQWNGGS